MNVAALRRMLSDPSISADTPVVVPFVDHQYRRVYASMAPAVVDGKHMYEAFDEPNPVEVMVFM